MVNDTDLDRAEATYATAIDQMKAAADAASDRDMERYSAALEARRTGILGGKRYSEAAILASWNKYAAGCDAFAALLQAHDARQAAEAVLDRARAARPTAGWRETKEGS